MNALVLLDFHHWFSEFLARRSRHLLSSMFGDRVQTCGLLSRAGQVMHDAFTFLWIFSIALHCH